MASHEAKESTWLKALAEATPDDLVWSTEPIPPHSMSSTVKTGYRPRFVRGCAVPEHMDPAAPGRKTLVVVVKAERGDDVEWYVLDWSRANADGAAQIAAASERDAKSVALQALMEAYGVQQRER